MTKTKLQNTADAFGAIRGLPIDVRHDLAAGAERIAEVKMQDGQTPAVVYGITVRGAVGVGVLV